MAGVAHSRRPGLTSAVTAVTVLLLVGLAALLAWSVLALSHATADVAEARSRLASYVGLQRAVGGEAFAEAGYRRAPGTAERQRLLTSIRAVDAAIDKARSVGTRRDRALLSYLQTVNDRYADEVRTTLDSRPGPGADDRVAGPALDAIQRLLDGAISGHRAEADRAALRQRAVLRTVSWSLPLVFVIALASLAVAWRQVRREQRRLRRLAAASDRRARTDGLTGLVNRDGFVAAAEVRLQDATSDVCVMLLDLDGFKPVNDTHGHAAGDEVLREVGRRLRGVVRSGDLVARLGGDEFALLLVGCDAPGAVAEKVVAVTAGPVRVSGDLMHVGASVGFARSPAHGVTLPRLLSRADAALYAAKAAGRGCVRSADDLAAPRSRLTLSRTVS